MSDESIPPFDDGEVVWVKISNRWWPGEICSESRLPEGLLHTIKKAPIAIVKFFQEDTYEFVRNDNHIMRYNCSRKNEFIKKGLELYRSNNKHMEKFPSDIQTAEKLTGGDENILENDAEFLPTKKLNYANIFGDPMKKVKKVKSVAGKKSSALPKRTHSTAQTIDLYRKNAPFTERRILPTIPRPPQTIVSPGLYKCHICDFTSTRQNVIILHTKSHKSSTPESRVPKGILKTSTPRSIPREMTSSRIESVIVIDDSDSDGTEIRSPVRWEPDARQRKSIQKSVTPDLSQDTPDTLNDTVNASTSSPVKRKKTENEIRTKILADWSDEESDVECETNPVEIEKNEQKIEEPPKELVASQEPIRLENELVQLIKSKETTLDSSAEGKVSPLATTEKNNAIPKYRNIPKKDRRDIVLKEFNNGDLLVGRTCVQKEESNEKDESNYQVKNNENISNTDKASEKIQEQNSDIPQTPEIVQLQNDEASPPSLESVKENPKQPQKPAISCFDFQEEDEDEDFLTSLSKLKKKYFSPDKNKDNATGIAKMPNDQENLELQKKDEELSAEIENLLNCTKLPDVKVDVKTMKPSTSDSVPQEVRALPPKERGKRIFKSRNRSRYEDTPIVNSLPEINISQSVQNIDVNTTEIPNTTEEIQKDTSEQNNSISVAEDKEEVIEEIVIALTKPVIEHNEEENKDLTDEDKVEIVDITEEVKSNDAMPEQHISTTEGIEEEASTFNIEENNETIEDNSIPTEEKIPKECPAVIEVESVKEDCATTEPQSVKDKDFEIKENKAVIDNDSKPNEEVETIKDIEEGTDKIIHTCSPEQREQVPESDATVIEAPDLSIPENNVNEQVIDTSRTDESTKTELAVAEALISIPSKISDSKLYMNTDFISRNEESNIYVPNINEQENKDEIISTHKNEDQSANSSPDKSYSAENENSETKCENVEVPLEQVINNDEKYKTNTERPTESLNKNKEALEEKEKNRWIGTRKRRAHMKFTPRKRVILPPTKLLSANVEKAEDYRSEVNIEKEENNEVKVSHDDNSNANNVECDAHKEVLSLKDEIPSPSFTPIPQYSPQGIPDETNDSPNSSDDNINATDSQNNSISPKEMETADEQISNENNPSKEEGSLKEMFRMEESSSSRDVSNTEPSNNDSVPPNKENTNPETKERYSPLKENLSSDYIIPTKDPTPDDKSLRQQYEESFVQKYIKDAMMFESCEEIKLHINENEFHPINEVANLSEPTADISSEKIAKVEATKEVSFKKEEWKAVSSKDTLSEIRSFRLRKRDVKQNPQGVTLPPIDKENPIGVAKNSEQPLQEEAKLGENISNVVQDLQQNKNKEENIIFSESAEKEILSHTEGDTEIDSGRTNKIDTTKFNPNNNVNNLSLDSYSENLMDPPSSHKVVTVRMPPGRRRSSMDTYSRRSPEIPQKSVGTQITQVKRFVKNDDLKISEESVLRINTPSGSIDLFKKSDKKSIVTDTYTSLSTQVSNLKNEKYEARTPKKRKQTFEDDIPSFVIEKPNISKANEVQPPEKVSKVEKESDVTADKQQVTQKPKSPQEMSGKTGEEVFDIHNMPILLTNDPIISPETVDKMQIVITGKTQAAVTSESIVTNLPPPPPLKPGKVKKTVFHQMVSGNNTIIQNFPISKAGGSSEGTLIMSHQGSQTIQGEGKKVGTDGKGNKFVIIKSGNSAKMIIQPDIPKNNANQKSSLSPTLNSAEQVKQSTVDRNVICNQTIITSKGGQVIGKISGSTSSIIIPKGQIIQAGAGGQIVITSKGTVITSSSVTPTVTKGYTEMTVPSSQIADIPTSGHAVLQTPNKRSQKLVAHSQSQIVQSALPSPPQKVMRQLSNKEESLNNKVIQKTIEKQPSTSLVARSETSQIPPTSLADTNKALEEPANKKSRHQPRVSPRSSRKSKTKANEAISKVLENEAQSIDNQDHLLQQHVHHSQKVFQTAQQQIRLQQHQDHQLHNQQHLQQQQTQIQQQVQQTPQARQMQQVQIQSQQLQQQHLQQQLQQQQQQQQLQQQQQQQIQQQQQFQQLQNSQKVKKRSGSHSKEKISSNPSPVLSPATATVQPDRATLVAAPCGSPDLTSKYGDGLLAVPAETFGGPANSFYLCTIAENETFVPIDHQPLYLDASNQLIPMVPAEPEPISQEKTATLQEAHIVVETAPDGSETILTDLSQITDSSNQSFLINTAEGHQILLDQQSLLALVANGGDGAHLVTPDGQQVVLPPELLSAIGINQPNELSGQILLSESIDGQIQTGNQDILAAALAGTEVYQQEQLMGDVLQIDPNSGVQIVEQGIAFQPVNQPANQPAQTSETNAILTQPPIMSTLEVPTNKKKSKLNSIDASKTNEAGLIGQNLDDSLAVIGVTTQSSAVPSSLELPITVTNPAIAPKTTANPITLGGIYTTGLPQTSQISPPLSNIGNEQELSYELFTSSSLQPQNSPSVFSNNGTGNNGPNVNTADTSNKIILQTSTAVCAPDEEFGNQQQGTEYPVQNPSNNGAPTYDDPTR